PTKHLHYNRGNPYGPFNMQAKSTAVRNVREAAPPIAGVRCQRIMIAGQNNDGVTVIAQHLRSVLQKFERLAMIVESVAREDHDVCANLIGSCQYFRECR